jgi:hypothetical protein
MQPLQRPPALRFDVPDRPHRRRFERTAQLARSHQLPQVREAGDAFGEDFADPNGVLIAAVRRFGSRLSRCRMAQDMFEIQEGDMARCLDHCLYAELRCPLPIA